MHKLHNRNASIGRAPAIGYSYESFVSFCAGSTPKSANKNKRQRTLVGFLTISLYWLWWNLVSMRVEMLGVSDNVLASRTCKLLCELQHALVYTALVTSTFRARWLASSEVISQVHLRAAAEKQNGFCRYIVTYKVTLWSASYSACVVDTKTVIHLSVGESGGYLPPLRWIFGRKFQGCKYYISSSYFCIL